MDAIFTSLGMNLSGVIALQLDPEVLVHRMTGRRVCPNCGAIANVHIDPPLHGLCAVCGHEMTQREDDKEETVRKRQQYYTHETMPLLNYYRERGLLREVDGLGSVDQVSARVADVLKSLSDSAAC